MRRGVIYLLVFSLLLNSIWIIYWFIHKPDPTPIFHPFDVNFHVTEESLLKSGYTFVLVDVPMLELRKGDTTITYSLNYYCRPTIPFIEDGSSICINTDVVYRRYSLVLSKVDMSELEKFIEENEGNILHYTRKDSGVNFWVQHQYSRVPFHCYIDTLSNGKYEFNAYCNFPIVNRREVIKQKEREKAE